ncbi:MAG: hypothetical protein M3464_18085, partial [Chloroflexota bacterium]|nr:hypothetical protein [Chloroflexota bacterium]
MTRRWSIKQVSPDHNRLHVSAEGSPIPARSRILLVDDEPPLVRLLTGYLSREGYEVLTAGDGLTALDLARTARP